MSNIGLIGLGVMGQNLVLNMLDNGYSVSVYNRTYEVTKDFLNNNSLFSEKLFGYEDLKEFVKAVERPRKIFLLVKAGDAVDTVISEISKYLDTNDIIIDTGNSYFKDSERRFYELKEKNIRFIGLGISGGEEGARHGASFMAGGDKTAYDEVENILAKASAKDFSGDNCVAYFGEGGAGHFVKMVHNGIEYVDMQLIADTYSILKSCSKDNDQIAKFFDELNIGRSSSYLIEITAKILKKKEENGNSLIDKILDFASQKGTGQWASESSIELGTPSFSFADAVFSRYLSGKKSKRENLSNVYKTNSQCLSLPPSELEKAYYVAKILSYAQGLEIIQAGAEEFNWNINLSEATRIWQGGCIIRAKLLLDLNKIFANNFVKNILEDQNISEIIKKGILSLRSIVSAAVLNGNYAPGFLSVINYFDGYTTKDSSANLIAAQRDFFGAHGYKRSDLEGDFHTDWN